MHHSPRSKNTSRIHVPTLTCRSLHVAFWRPITQNPPSSSTGTFPAHAKGITTFVLVSLQPRSAQLLLLLTQTYSGSRPAPPTSKKPPDSQKKSERRILEKCLFI